MNISDRILQYLEFKGITKNKFYVNVGLSNGFLDKKPNIGADKIERILEFYPDINLYWLILGVGPMEAPQSGNICQVEEPSPAYGACKQCQLRDQIINEKSEIIELLKYKIARLYQDLNNNGKDGDIRQTAS